MCFLSGEGRLFLSSMHVLARPPDERVLSENRRFAMQRAIALWAAVIPSRFKQVLVVVLKAQMGNQVLAAKVAQRVLEFHQLNKDVVLGIEMWSHLW